MREAGEQLARSKTAENDESGSGRSRLAAGRTASGTNLLGTPPPQTSGDWRSGPGVMTPRASPCGPASQGGSSAGRGTPDPSSGSPYSPGKLSPKAFLFTNGDASHIHVAEAVFGDGTSAAREEPHGSGRAAAREGHPCVDGAGTGSGTGCVGGSSGVESRENFVVLLRVRPLQEKEVSAGEICAWEVVAPATVRALFAAPKAGRAAPLRTASAPPPPSLSSHPETPPLASTGTPEKGSPPGSSPGLTTAQGPSPQRHALTPLPLSSRPTWNFGESHHLFARPALFVRVLLSFRGCVLLLQLWKAAPAVTIDSPKNTEEVLLLGEDKSEGFPIA